MTSAKYENDLGAHLEKWSQTLAENIADMRDKIDRQKSLISAKKARNQEILEKMKQIESSSANSQKKIERKTRELQELEGDIQRNTQEIEHNSGIADQIDAENKILRSDVDELTAKIVEMEGTMPRQKAEGGLKNMKAELKKAKQELAIVEKRKLEQNSYISRLRDDIEKIDKTNEGMRKKLVDLKNSHPSDGERLGTLKNIYENENLGILDEFSNLMKELSRTPEVMELSEGNNQKVDDAQKMYNSTLNTETQRLRRNLRAIQKELATERNLLQKLKKRIEIEHLKPKISEEQLENLKQQEYQLELNKIFNKYGPDFQKFSKQVYEAVPQMKNSEDKNLKLLEDFKRDIVNLKREEDALSKRVSRIKEKKEQVTQELTAATERLAEESELLRKAENEYDYISKEEAALDSTTIPNANEKESAQLRTKIADTESIIVKLENTNTYDAENLKRILLEVEQLEKSGPNLELEKFKQTQSEIELKEKEIKLENAKISDLKKKAYKLQRELELSVAQRDCSVGKALSIIFSQTNVRAEREEEMRKMKEGNEQLKLELMSLK